MTFISFFLSLLISLNPSSDFNCDGDRLTAVIRNNLNGDFAITNNLENIDKGAFVVLHWRDINLMLPVSLKSVIYLSLTRNGYGVIKMRKMD